MPRTTLNTLWLKTGADSELKRTSSRLKAIPLHSAPLALSCWSQNKASRSNHEKRWVGRAGPEKRWRLRKKRAVNVCVRERERERRSEWEIGLCIINPMNSEAPGWLLRGVCVSKTPNHPVHCACCLREKLFRDAGTCFFFLFFFFLFFLSPFPHLSPVSALQLRQPYCSHWNVAHLRKNPHFHPGTLFMHMHTVGFSSAAHGNEGPLRSCAQWGEPLKSSQHNMASPCRWIARLLSAASTVHLNLFWEGSNSTALQISPSSRRRHTVNK